MSGHGSPSPDATPWRETAAVGGAWFLASLALYLVTGAQGLVWGDSSKLTLYALAHHFPSLNPGDHAGWTLLAWGWLRALGGDPVVVGAPPVGARRGGGGRRRRGAGVAARR